MIGNDGYEFLEVLWEHEFVFLKMKNNFKK